MGAWSVNGSLQTTTKSGAPLGKNAPSAMLLDEHAVVKNSVDFEKKARRQVKNR